MMLPVAVVLSLLLSGCAGSRGFDREAMLANLHLGSGEASAPQIEALTSSNPLRLALYFVERNFPAHQTMRKAEWFNTDKEALKNRLLTLREQELVQDVFLIEDVMIRGHDTARIRQAGLRYGADAVLIVDGVGAVDRYSNQSAWLYATVVGAYLASGTESQALFIIDGSLWDTRTERLYIRQRVEGTGTIVGPAMLVEDHEALRQARYAALDTFGQRLLHALRRSDGLPSR